METTKREKRTAQFRAKNQRRREARADVDKRSADAAKRLRCVGITKKVTTVIPMPEGEDMRETHEVIGVSGAFGWGTRDEWNARLVGTLGAEK